MTKFAIFCASLVTAIHISASTGSAATVTYDSVDFDVSTLSGTFDDYSVTLMSQVWWGDHVIADAFATLVDTALGGVSGPLFAYASNDTDFVAIFNLDTQDPNPGTDERRDEVFTFAVASAVPAVPLPAGGLLLLTGLGAAAGLSFRKKRTAQV